MAVKEVCKHRVKVDYNVREEVIEVHDVIFFHTRHFPGLGERFCNGPGTEFVCSPYHL